MTYNTNLSSEIETLHTRLVEWGLSGVEADVYLYLVQTVGEAGGSKIAFVTGLHRQYVYTALERLIETRLVEPVAHGKRKKYKARSPKEIDKITRLRSINASNLVQDLSSVYAAQYEQDFEVLQGEKQIQQSELDYAYGCDDGAEQYIIGGHSQGFVEVMGEQLEEYLETANRKKIKVLYLGSEEERDLYKKFIGSFPNQEYRFMKKLPNGVTHMVIRSNTVSFYSFLNPPLVYITKSAIVAENYKQFFMMLWDIAGKET